MRSRSKSLGSLRDLVGFGGLVLEEAEGGIALAEDACLQETANALGQIERTTVFSDYEGTLAEKWGGAEEAEDAVVLIFFGVGRVDEREIEGGVGGLVAGREFFEGAEGVEGEDVRSVGDFEGLEIATNQDGGGGVILDEHDFCCAATNGFDTDGAGAGEDVEEAGAADVGAEHVEEGFTQTIAGGAEGVAPEAFQDAAAIFAGDDAHCIWGV